MLTILLSIALAAVIFSNSVVSRREQPHLHTETLRGVPTVPIRPRVNPGIAVADDDNLMYLEVARRSLARSHQNHVTDWFSLE